MRLRKRLGAAWIAEATVEQLVTEADAKYPLETGGVLMGYWAREFDEVVITQAIGPGPAAVHQKRGFVPDADFHAEKIARLYRDSGRLQTYLGDWHTHPGGTPALSWKDTRTLARLAREPAARAPFPLMAILAGSKQWKLAVWRYSRAALERFALWPRPVALGVRIYS